jgi:hypothetical protein
MSLASLYFRGGDFFLKWKGHFSFWCSAQKFLGRWRGEENSVTPRFSRSSALAFPRIHAFLFAADFFWILEWLRGSEGGFPLRRKLTEFNAVMLRSVVFHLDFYCNGSFGRK